MNGSNKTLSWELSSLALCIHKSTAIREPMIQLIYLYYGSRSIPLDIHSPSTSIVRSAVQQLEFNVWLSFVYFWLIALSLSLDPLSYVCYTYSSLPIRKHGHMFYMGTSQKYIIGTSLYANNGVFQRLVLAKTDAYKMTCNQKICYANRI